MKMTMRMTMTRGWLAMALGGVTALGGVDSVAKVATGQLVEVPSAR